MTPAGRPSPRFAGESRQLAAGGRALSRRTRMLPFASRCTSTTSRGRSCASCWQLRARSSSSRRATAPSSTSPRRTPRARRPPLPRRCWRGSGIAGRKPTPHAPWSTRHGFDVARHLFRVAAGLESVVPGETEILGQVREAWLESQEASTAGPLLNALFQRALESGRRVRAETPLARRPASVASAAVELADRATGGLAGRRVVVLGAGAMARAVCSSLLRRRAGRGDHRGAQRRARRRGLSGIRGVRRSSWGARPAA